MARKPKKQPEPPVQNPRYMGVTPNMVTRALLQSHPAQPDEPEHNDETLVQGA